MEQKPTIEDLIESASEQSRTQTRKLINAGWTLIAIGALILLAAFSFPDRFPVPMLALAVVMIGLILALLGLSLLIMPIIARARMNRSRRKAEEETSRHS